MGDSSIKRTKLLTWLRKSVLRVFLAGITLASFHLMAAEPRQMPSDQEKARTVSIFHQPVVMLQAKFGLSTPEERVLRIRNTLRALTEEDMRHPVQILAVERYGQHGRLFVINGKPLMLLAESDLDEGDDLTLDQAALRVMARFDAQRTSMIEQYSSSYLTKATLKVLAGTAVLIMLYYAAFKSWAWVKAYFTARILLKKGWIPYRWRSLLGAIEVHLYALLMILLSIVAFYIWLSWLFRLYPWTRIWGESLGEWSVDVVQKIALSIVSAFPGLMIVAIIFLITAFILKLLKILLRRVETRKLHVPGMHPETVSATRKLISVMIWLFALSAAYPFMPGANSLAFKGVSVFFGLMLTLGSAGVMNHAMSGLVLIYSRALRKGDVIRIGENEGLVSEIGMLATKIITRENYIVTVPNAVVVSGKITNLSAQNPGGGVNLTTSVTIGYDTPWRQVQRLLLDAAGRTGHVQHAPPAYVLQTALNDFYVAYVLRVHIVELPLRADILSALHANIQDAFNAAGVQIMSPNYIADPELPKIVAPEDWDPKGPMS